MSFSGKVVLVTGAASGIGAATAEQFLREKAAVAMVDKDGAKLQLAVEKIKNGHHQLLAITADITNDEDVKRSIRETINSYGKLDVLVNCAGVIRYGTILGGNLMQAYDDLIKVNLRAVMQMTCQAAPYLVASKGNIVNIASVGGHRVAVSDFLSYCVSKAGVSHFTKGAAFELASQGVRVNSISPGVVRTNIAINSGRENSWQMYEEATPFKRILEPDEVSDLVLYLASDKAKGITGSDFVIDNGSLLK